MGENIENELQHIKTRLEELFELRLRPGGFTTPERAEFDTLLNKEAVLLRRIRGEA